MVKKNVDYVDVSTLSSENKKRLQGVVTEASEALERIANEKEQLKEMVTDICTELSLDKKLINKIVNAYYKDSFKEDVEFNEKFEVWYDGVVNSV